MRAVAFLGRHRELAEKYPDKVGPNIRDNVAEGLGYSALDVARALSLQTALYRSWQTFFGEHDFVIAPTVTISPRPWSELYPAAIDGTPTKSYFHWLALAYAVTNAGHPVVAIPAGRDGAGLPFGIQIIGPRGGDVATLAVAREIEALLGSQSGDGPSRPRSRLAAPSAADVLPARFSGFRLRPQNEIDRFLLPLNPHWHGNKAPAPRPPLPG